MKFHTRKLIKPEDLNGNNTLFGGRLLQWIDEEAGIYAMTKLGTTRVVTKYISEINFINSARQGEIVEIGLRFVDIGRTSITFACEVRNIFTKKTIITIDRLVFVNLNEQDRPEPHGLTVSEIIQNAVYH
jgi:acyl-CoA hydrolase